MTDSNLTYRQSATGRLAFERVTEQGDSSLACTAEAHAAKLQEWPSFCREVFGRIYRPADAVDNPLAQPEPWAAKATASLESHPEFSELRAAARGSRILSATAASSLASGVATAMGIDRLAATDAAQAPHEHRRAVERACQLAHEMRADGNDAAADATEAAARLQGIAWKNALARRANAAKSVDAAAIAIGCVAVDVAEQVSKQALALGTLKVLLAGAGVGEGSSEMDGGEIPDDLVRMIVKGGMLADVLALLGKMKDSSIKAFSAPVGKGKLDVTGVTMGGDAQRLVGSELALLGRLDTRLDVMRRLQGKSAMVREQRGEEQQNRGDFVLLGDRSGSMQGRRIVMARAALLAMMLEAVKGRRRVVLVMFDNHVRPAVVVDRHGKGIMAALRELMLEPSGGTDAVGAMVEARRHLSTVERQRVDTAIVTDGDWTDPPVDVQAVMRRAGGQFHEVRIVDRVTRHASNNDHPWMDSFTALGVDDVDGAVTATKTITRRQHATTN